MSTDQSALLERYHAALTGVFGRPTRVLVRGEGVHVWDADGRRYTDLLAGICLLYTSPSPRDATLSRMPSSA